MDLFDHPGFMSYGSSFEVLHADWPVYPAGHGWQVALASLAVFPPNVSFRRIDDIDQCYLFIARDLGPAFESHSDPYDSRCFHVAVWHKDLLDLHSRAFISGTSLESAYDCAMAQYQKRSEWIVERANGFEKMDIPKPQPEDYESFVGGDLKQLEIGANGISVTIAGREALQSLARPVDQLDSTLGQRVKPLLGISYHDVSVREASVILEARLREVTKASSYGQRLVDEYFESLCSRNQGRATAFFKVLRGELRTIVKFVRNDYAHALHEISESQCRVLLDRISQALEMINQIEKA